MGYYRRETGTHIRRQLLSQAEAVSKEYRCAGFVWDS